MAGNHSLPPNWIDDIKLLKGNKFDSRKANLVVK